VNNTEAIILKYGFLHVCGILKYYVSHSMKIAYLKGKTVSVESSGFKGKLNCCETVNL
jgi:hypothetical protein